MNNRQAGRRRGRGGQRQGGNPGRPDNGNRIDNRARGNAAQLLEKYKNLAQDAQRSGDRVSTEYYLQFADHYFRVLAESRSRQDDGQPRRNRDDEDEAEGVEDFGFEGDLGSPAFYQQPQVQQRQDGDRDDRPRSRDGGNRDTGNRDNGNREMANRDGGNRDDRDDRPRGREDQPREARPRREASNEDRPRRDRDSSYEDRPRRDRSATVEGSEDRPRRETTVRDTSGDDRPRRDRAAASDTGDERPRREPRAYTRQPAAEPQDDMVSQDQAGSHDEASPQVAPAEAEPRRRGRPRREVTPVESSGLDVALLPPSISTEPAPVSASNDDAAPERPRRGRPRRVRTDDETSAA